MGNDTRAGKSDNVRFISFQASVIGQDAVFPVFLGRRFRDIVQMLDDCTSVSCWSTGRSTVGRQSLRRLGCHPLSEKLPRKSNANADKGVFTKALSFYACFGQLLLKEPWVKEECCDISCTTISVFYKLAEKVGLWLPKDISARTV